MPASDRADAPYVGPRPFQVGEPIFGRDWEIRTLSDQLAVERLVLLHSTSGAGKTSLVQAGLIPKLNPPKPDPLRFIVYGPMRVNHEATEAEKLANPNRYVLSTLLELAKWVPGGPIEPAELNGLTLPSFFEKFASRGETGPREFLFFDQFEEVLTVGSLDRDARLEFFSQLGAILQAPHRFALFAMREEYVAALETYLEPLPRGLSAHYRLDLLGPDAAKEAILRPAERAKFDIDPKAADTLIEELRRVQVQKPDGSVEPGIGPYLEPVQLQVVCLRLWERKKGGRLKAEDVSDAAGTVNTALQEYYRERIHLAAGEKASEGVIRLWIEKNLISEDNLRTQVLMGRNKTQGLHNGVIQDLVDAYLLRREDRGGKVWFELAHDRLIGPIRADNRAERVEFKQSLPSSRRQSTPSSSPSVELASAEELEIGLNLLEDGRYLAQIRYRPADGSEEVIARSEVFGEADALPGLGRDSEQTAAALTSLVFGEPTCFALLSRAQAEAAVGGRRLRVVLALGGSPDWLQELPWERLGDPSSGSPLLLGPRIVFTRYVGNWGNWGDWYFRPVKLRRVQQPRCLLVVAHPTDLDRFRPQGMPLLPVDVAAEVSLASSQLSGYRITELSDRMEPGLRPTPDGVINELAAGYEIFYLITHIATSSDGEPGLYLSGPDGRVMIWTGGELSRRLSDLQAPPPLVVVKICAIDKRMVGGSLMRLGTSLCRAGVPAFLTVGPVPAETEHRFLSAFFPELLREGQVDWAVAQARRAVADTPSWWPPTLFTRLRSVRVWLAPGAATARAGLPGFEETVAWRIWLALLNEIRERRFVPILGFGLLEAFIGSGREIARRWAEKLDFALVGHQFDDLPQVAQYLAVTQSSGVSRYTFVEHLTREVLRRFPDLPTTAKLDDLLEAARTRHAESSLDPYRVLAELPLPVYLMAAPDEQLIRALRAVGKQPSVEIWQGSDEGLLERSSAGSPRTQRSPNQKQPLVYYLFGRFDAPDSLLLTQDDYFKFLSETARNRESLPTEIRRVLAESGMLFLGFGPDEWGFRVLLHTFRLLTTVRAAPSVRGAVFPDPEEGQARDPARARRYVEQELGSMDIRVYWGSTEDFLEELQRRWTEVRRDP